MTYAAHEARREAIERRHTEPIRDALMEHGDALAAAVEREDYPLSAFAEDGPIIEALQSLYDVTVPAFAAWTYAELEPEAKAAPGIETKAEAKGVADWVAVVTDFIQRDGGTMIRAVRRTTLRLVREVLAEGVEEGWGTDRIAAEIRDRWAALSRRRAERIARTETMRAANYGAVKGAERAAADFGLVVEKEWLATFDGRARDSHMAMHGRRVALDQPFDLFGHAAMQPGDASLPASESVNCRCAVALVPVGVRSWRDERNAYIAERYKALLPRHGREVAFQLIAEDERVNLSPHTVRDIVYKEAA